MNGISETNVISETNIYVILNYIYLLSNKIKPEMSDSKNIINTSPAELDKIIKN